MTSSEKGATSVPCHGPIVWGRRSRLSRATDASGERSESYDQTTPVDLVFEAASRLSCRIESDGALEVVAQGPGGNVSRSRTSGGTVTLSLGR